MRDEAFAEVSCFSAAADFAGTIPFFAEPIVGDK